MGKNNTAHEYCYSRIRLRSALERNGQFKIDDDGHRNEIFPCEFCPSYMCIGDAFLSWEYFFFAFWYEIKKQ